MEFNLRKFLTENKLTRRSLLNEDDTTGGMMKTNAEKAEMEGDEEMFDPDSADPFGGEYEKSKYGTTIDTHEVPEKDYEAEPADTSIKADRATKNLHTRQQKLQDLEDKKDALLMQLKSGQLTLDQYKAAIGTIPAEIKKLRADIDAALKVTGDEEDELA